MKKGFLTLAAILVLLLVCFAGYVQYRKWASFKTLIHQDATAVIRINAYGLIESVLPDYLSRKPSKENKDDGGNGEHRGSGLELPANVFIYTVRGKTPTTLFTTLDITNVKDFEFTAHDKIRGLVRSEPGAAYAALTSPDGKLTIYYTAEKAAIAFSQEGEPVATTLQDIILGRNVVSLKESPFRELADAKGHVTFLSGKNAGRMDFQGGAVEARLSLETAIATASAVHTHTVAHAQQTAAAWLNADLRPLLAGRTFTIGSHAIRADSLLAYYHNAVSLEIAGSVTQEEKVVTYGYDENFEKQEQTEIRQVKVPGIYLTIAAAPGLAQYLTRQGIILADSNVVSRAVFPLYQLRVRADSAHLLVSTDEPILPSGNSYQDKGFAGLNVSFDELERQQLFPPAARYIRLFKALKVDAAVNSGNQIHINLKLTFDNSKRNALLQLGDDF